MKPVIVFAFFLVVIAGGVFLATRTIAPQPHLVEKVLPNDKFLK